MTLLRDLLLLLAAVSFLLATIEARIPRIDLTALGLLLATLAFLVVGL